MERGSRLWGGAQSTISANAAAEVRRTKRDSEDGIGMRSPSSVRSDSSEPEPLRCAGKEESDSLDMSGSRRASLLAIVGSATGGGRSHLFTEKA